MISDEIKKTFGNFCIVVGCSAIKDYFVQYAVKVIKCCTSPKTENILSLLRLQTGEYLLICIMNSLATHSTS